ncbi:MAG: hypothetical protein ACYSTS_17840 [Planctomycetota bacterium]|jgi:hypothetical protein
MKKLILIIMFLLLCPSFVLAEEKGDNYDEGIIKRAENMIALRSIATDIFAYEIRERYEEAYRLWALLEETGYKDFAQEVLNDVRLDKIFEYDWFYKHNKKYKYNIDDRTMLELMFPILDGMIAGYRMGIITTLSVIFAQDEDLAERYKNSVPEQSKKYLEDKKKAESNRSV